jgi:CRP-like cAMP-binding protein
MSTKLLQEIDEAEADQILTTYFDPRVIEMRSTRGINKGIYLIESGRLLLFIPVDSGRDRSDQYNIELARLEPGDFFGEIRTLVATGGDRWSAASSVAEAPLRLRKLRVGRGCDPAETLLELFKHHSQVALNMLTEMARRLAATNRFVYWDTKDKVRLELLRLSSGDPKARIVTSQRAIARAIGVKGESVRSALSYLVAQKMIEVIRRSVGKRSLGVSILIHDRNKLEDGLLSVY